MKANAYRTKKNATIAVTFLWSFILIANIPQLFLYSSYEYLSSDERRIVCILKYNIILAEASIKEYSSFLINSAEFKLQLYYIIFILLAYIVPLVTIVIIYALIIIKLSKSKGKSFNIFQKKKKKQKTKYNFFN
jgi:hypothetical protein